MGYYHSVIDAIAAGELERMEENKPICEQSQHKVGDRVYFYLCQKHGYPQVYSYEVGTARIVKIEHDFYIDDNGKRVDFHWYYVGPNEKIESYNCLPKTCKDVQKFIYNNGGVEDYLTYQEELEEFIVLKGWVKDRDYVKGFIKEIYKLEDEQ